MKTTDNAGAHDFSEGFPRQEQSAHQVNSQDLLKWMEDPIWVVYALDTGRKKKLQVSARGWGFRVTHGQEIVYEGRRMDEAVSEYNNITSLPESNDAPKTTN